MPVLSIEQIELFLLFILPGFISIKAYELFFPKETLETGKQLVEALTYSLLNYALLYLPITSINNSSMEKDCPFLYYFFYFIVLFIAPIIWVLIWKKIRLSKLIQKEMPHPVQKPWDYVFSKKKSYWIIIILKNGKKIAGKYSSNSFSSSTPALEQIYLEEHWKMDEDDTFKRPRKNTEGILILSNEISSVEFFKYGE